MDNTDIKFIYTQEQLLQTIKEHSQKAKTIQLYCTNFESYYHHRIMNGTIELFEYQLVQHLLNLAQNTDIEIEVFSYNSPDIKNIIAQSSRATYYLDSSKKINDTPTNKSICVYNMQTAQSSILCNFVKSLCDKLPNQNIESLSEAIDEFIKQTNSYEALLNSIDEQLKKPFIQKTKQLNELEYLGNIQDLENSLNIVFDELNQSIQKIYQDGNSQIYKEIVNFFFNIIDIFSIKKIFAKSNLLLFGADILFEGSKTLSNILEWADSKYSYAISNSILKPLTQEIAPLITLFENHTLHNTLIIDDTILIDFSGLGTQTNELPVTLKQNLGVCLQLQKPELSIKDLVHDNEKLVFQNKTIGIYGKGKICEFLQNQMSTSKNRFAYIESPFFNSTKLVELIKEEQNKKETDESKQGFNYLVISNAPYKHNAGLSATLINTLNNTIFYGNSSLKNTNTMLHQKPDKDYNAVVDYSKYQIKINATKKEAYVLNLSPFVHIDKQQYLEYKKLYDEYISWEQQAYLGMGEMLFSTFPNNKDQMQKIASYQYIQSFFKQPVDKKEIVEKEEQYFKESIACLRGYIKSMITIKDIDYDIYHYGYEYEEPKRSYSALEVLLLALSYYVIKNFYSGIKTDPQWLFIWSYEYIKIADEEINMLSKDSYIETLDNNNIPICFSIKQKENNNQIFCIEEFVLAIEKSEQHKDLSQEDQETLNMLFENIESHDDSNTNDDIFQNIQDNLQIIDNKLSQIKQQQEQQTQIDNQKILEEILKNFITAYFPFSSVFFNLSGIDIIHKLTKTLLKLSFSQKLSTFLIEELGFLYLATILTSSEKQVYISQPKANNSRANAKLKQIKKQAFIQLARIHKTQAFEIIALGDITNNPKIKSLEDRLQTKYTDINDKQKQKAAIEKEIIKQKGLFAKEFITDTFKDFAKGLPQAMALNIFNQTFVTEYEKSKKEFERLQFIKLNYKYNYPYALQRDEGVYYPMIVHNTFFSFNLYDMVIGGRLKTGGLGVLDALFYHLSNASPKQASDYLLQKLLGYILLDELRGVSKDTNYYINDIDFFANGTNKASLEILKNKKELYKLRDENKLQAFKKLDANEGEKAIDCYNACIDILSDFINGNINTNTKTNIYHAKYRELLEKLNIIGHNNIKAMYVGIDPKGHYNIPRPKSIGRLATTIIMEDGLWIG